MTTNQRLRQLAERLPPVPKYDPNGKMIMREIKVRVLGSEILKVNPEAMEERGKLKLPINPLMHYTVKKRVPTMADHFEGLQYFWKQHQEEGVEKYIEQCYKFNKMPRPVDMVFKEPSKIIML